MHVGLDLLFLVPGETGGRETYARELLTALRRVRPEICVTTFLNRETAAAGAGFWSEQADAAIVLPRVSARSRGRWAAGELAGVAHAASSAGVDVLHGPANFAPLHGRFARVLTLHDLLFRRLPELMPAPVRLATAALVVPAARRAHCIVTVSEASRREIVAELGVPGERVVAIPNGIAPPPESSLRADPGRARSRFGLPEGRPIVLAVATDLLHKNLPTLVDAIAAIAPERRPLLVLVGHGTDAGPLAQRARSARAGEDVRALGAVSTASLEDLYAAAALLATTTRYEGFGLPVLEAMARGVPVACSDIPVLREVAGDAAAAWFDPSDAGAVTSAIETLLADGADLERWRAAGRERAARFTWDVAAEATAQAYEWALLEAGRGHANALRSPTR